ncbi:putative F-box domain-containing protein [Medicago truncatula]|uniref:Putative F-box domain-containing protein n=1 Tax=Medicago truncatula TaxID=3880 RepID=A0A396JM74_MEDTR|nr:putative F-box domain-containing protein [Medicago truncatula]
MEETTASIGTLTLGDSLHTPPLVVCIPFDLIIEILCRLPVKFLLQFRCVCKSWNSLISNDPKFTKKHLHMMSTTKHRHLVTTTWIMAKELTVTSYPFDSLQLDSIFTSNPTQLDYSPIITSWQDGLIASCDGLLCFVIDQRLAVLYNPCIRKVKKLPSLDLPREEGTDSWRRIKDFPSMFRFGRHGVVVCGTVNWLTYYNSSDLGVIVSLHLGKESYQEIPVPDSGDFFLSTLDMMRECLCIFSRKRTDSFTDVWLEYGNKESWIKLISLPIFDVPYHTVYTRIVYISEDNNQVLLIFREDRRLKWVVYDCKMILLSV